jgi:hypothetical protein
MLLGVFYENASYLRELAMISELAKKFKTIPFNCVRLRDYKREELRF